MFAGYLLIKIHVITYTQKLYNLAIYKKKRTTYNYAHAFQLYETNAPNHGFKLSYFNF